MPSVFNSKTDYHSDLTSGKSAFRSIPHCMLDCLWKVPRYDNIIFILDGFRGISPLFPCEVVTQKQIPRFNWLPCQVWLLLLVHWPTNTYYACLIGRMHDFILVQTIAATGACCVALHIFNYSVNIYCLSWSARDVFGPKTDRHQPTTFRQWQTWISQSRRWKLGHDNKVSGDGAGCGSDTHLIRGIGLALLTLTALETWIALCLWYCCILMVN